ncbi:MAG: RadC family protein [Kiritimatiellia bacterium]
MGMQTRDCTPYKALRIEDLPKDLQPRELLGRVGPRHVGEDILLAVILRVGVVGANAIETARRLLVAFGSLSALSEASYQEIAAKKIPGIGKTKALGIAAALELGRRCSYAELMKNKNGDAKYIQTSEDIYNLILPEVYGEKQERFFVVMLGPRNKVMTSPLEIAKGQRDEVALLPNLVFERPLKEGARAIIVAHNHPSGDSSPSEEDIVVTRNLIEVGKLMNIPILDHLIVGVPCDGHSGFFSMAASGVLEF